MIVKERLKPPFHRAWNRIWPVIGAVSVRTKIMGIVLSLMLLLGLGVTVEVRLVMQRTLSDQLEQRGVSIARDLAARSTDLILTNNTFALFELVRDTVENNADVRYAFVLDSRGNVLVHSFGQGFPLDLLTVNPVYPNQHHRLEILDTEEGLIRDVAVPIFEGRAGVARVGLSERGLRHTVADTTRQLLLTTLLVSLVGVLAGYALTWVLTRPVLDLVRVTRAVAQGDLEQKAPPWAEDEIGYLAESFNVMIDSLARVRRESDAYSAQLLRRNRELSALNAVARAVSGPLSLDEALDRALSQVLEVVASQVGWICLLDGEGGCRASAGLAGLCQPPVGGASRCLNHCGCGEVIRIKRPLVISPLIEGCPLRGVELGEGRQAACHVTVPLLVKGQVLGLLNIAGHDQACISDDDLELLAAIGHQLGVAIENSQLWDELRRKEALRGRLLEQVIGAQEEERKRIARELHDETGQTLTSIMLGLRLVEDAPSLPAVRARTLDLKTIAAQALQRVRDLALELRPSLLDDLGLVDALEHYVEGYQARTGLAVEFETIGLAAGSRLPPQVEITLYRVVQEALTNVARHARAHHVSVLLERRNHSVVAIVEDDGRGFEVQRVLGTSDLDRRLGLYGMQERAELVGGTLTLESTLGVGSTVFVEVPLNGLAAGDVETVTRSSEASDD